MVTNKITFLNKL